MVEFSVTDASMMNFTPLGLKALFNRPVTFRREAVGGMGTGMCCMANRIKALGGECGARLRADNASGTVVWFRFPLEACVDTQHVFRSSLMLNRNSIKMVRARASDSLVFVSKKNDFGMSSKGGMGGAPSPPPMSRSLTRKGQEAIGNEIDIRRLVILDEKGGVGGGPSQAPAAVVTPLVNSKVDKPLKGLTILVVDDATTIVTMVVRMLTAAGAMVDFAKDGREGVDMFKTAEPAFDIVITDIQVCAHSCYIDIESTSLPSCAALQTFSDVVYY